MKLPDDPPRSRQINIVPMIDVLFAVLTFFVVSTLFMTQGEGIPVNLPTAATADPQPSLQIVVSIRADGSIFLNQNPIEPVSLSEAVRQLMTTEQSTWVVLQADESVTHGQVIAVMDRLRQVEGLRLGIATRPPNTANPDAVN